MSCPTVPHSGRLSPCILSMAQTYGGHQACRAFLLPHILQRVLSGAMLGKAVFWPKRAERTLAAGPRTAEVRREPQE